ncbi:YbbR-like domain-containing protein [Maribacter sp. 2308TA10-17]|uniref:CdaR family protein n=1 Tax=Maribacter sp. 2308TA10-17 TaxID=3386276 RepID=UPI0039BC95C3
MIQKIKNSLKKRKVKIFLVFLFCSTSAWFISNLSESFISNTTFDLEFVNASDDLLLVNTSQDKINAKLEAVGFQFLGFNFKNKAVTIDLSEVSKEGRQYHLPYQKFKAQIEKQLPSSMRLIDIEKDTLFFDFQEVISKEVPVKPMLQLTLEQNFLLDGKLVVEPDTVTIKGPRNEVDTIASVKSLRIDLIDLSDDFSRNTSIKVPEGLRYTSFSASTVTITGKVSRFSERMITVNVKAMNFPTGTAIKMFPDQVKVLCKGTINTLKNLDVSDFEVIADFKRIRKTKSKKIPLILEKKPETLSSAILQEKEVEYILKRKE